nr:NAD(P)-dependent oxidoreductase [Anaerolineae bacterium]
TYQPIPVQALVAGMTQMGLPAPIAQLVASFDAAIAAGQLDGVSGAVNDLTGTPAQSARAFLAANLTALTTPPAA